MPDPKTPEQLLAEAKAFAEAGAIKLKEESTKILSSFDDEVKKLYNNIVSSGKLGIKSAEDFGQALLKNKSFISGMIETYQLARSAFATTDLFSGAKGSAAVFSGIGDQIKGMGADFEGVKNLINKFDPTNMLTKVTNAQLTNAELAEKSTQSMIGMLSAGGNLRTLFDANGNALGDLNTQTLKYTSSLINVAEANATTLASTIAYADAFNRIPGVMKENISVGGNVNSSMSALSAAMKVMSGSGQDFNTVMTAMNIAYENVGNAMGPVLDKGQKGIALFSMMSTLSKDLGLEFKETSGFLGEMAKQFKFIGDNTEAAARIMARFTDGLRNTGLTSNASIEIIKGMTESVSKLTIGTKAFVSARSGGPGGLQGAVQMDVMARQGKTDEVMQMVLNTMKQQFGGRIVTQAEGAQSQEAAATFTRQKMMLQSGAFGNLVGTGPEADTKATHLLEMLATGDIGGAVKTSQEAINEVASQGNDLQKQSNTILNKIALISEQSNLGIQTMALSTIRRLGGAEGSNREMLEKGMLTAAGKSSKEIGMVEGGSAKKPGEVSWISSIGLDKTKGGGDDKRKLIKDMEQDIESKFLNSIYGIKDAAKQGFDDGKTKLAGIRNKFKQGIDEIAEEVKNKKISEGTPTIINPRTEMDEKNEKWRSLFKPAIPLPQRPGVTVDRAAGERARSSAPQQRQTTGGETKITINLSKTAKDEGVIVESIKTEGIDNRTSIEPGTR